MLTTFQDNGRLKYLSQGINRGGVMDRLSFELLNALLGNRSGEAAMEIHFPGPELLFEEDCLFALTGADLSPVLNDTGIANSRIFEAKKGDILRFKKKIKGERAYFGVSGGFDSDDWLGSKSAGFNADGVLKQDSVIIRSSPDRSVTGRTGISRAFDPDIRPLQRIRFVEGNEWGSLSENSRRSMESSVFEISPKSNRMGYRLSGKRLELENEDQLLSSAVTFGTIQLPPDGQLIILMADAQTTGGYPRIGFVAAADLPVLAQCGAGQHLFFEKISLEEAEDLLRKQASDIIKLKAAVNFNSI